MVPVKTLSPKCCESYRYLFRIAAIALTIAFYLKSKSRIVVKAELRTRARTNNVALTSTYKRPTNTVCLRQSSMRISIICILIMIPGVVIRIKSYFHCLERLTLLESTNYHLPRAPDIGSPKPSFAYTYIHVSYGPRSRNKTRIFDRSIGHLKFIHSASLDAHSVVRFRSIILYLP
ncbi:hypothetical protein BJ912DRAFT_305842 [Pholiota molesta]|nr:hypothetical protein BJ912DRAFT_305842 [Pholiota molesta]